MARLELCISGEGYLEEGLSHFVEVSIKDNNEIRMDIEKLEPVSNSKDKKKNNEIYKKSKKLPKLMIVLPPLVCLPVFAIGLSLYLLYLF